MNIVAHGKLPAATLSSNERRFKFLCFRGGNFDHGEPILLPNGKTLAPKQLQEVTTVISERQAEVVVLLEEEMLRSVPRDLCPQNGNKSLTPS